MKVLVCEDNHDIRDLIVFILESEYDFTILEAENGEEGIEVITQNPDLNYIISDYNMPGKNGGAVYLHAKKLLNIPFLLLTSEAINDLPEFTNFYEENEFNKYLQKPCSGDRILETFNEFYNNAQDNTKNDEQDYIRVNIKRFLKYNTTKLNIFIKINKEKYLKISHENEDVEKEQLQKYIDKGVNDLFVDKTQYDEFIAGILKKLSQMLLKSLNTKKSIQSQLIATSEMQVIAKEMGITEQIIEVADKLTSVVIEEVKSDKNLSKALEKILKSDGYIAKHTILINYLNAVITKDMGWDEDSILKKLIFSSLFCDISLDSELAKIQSLESEHFKELDLSDRKKVKEHVLQVTDLLQSNNNIMNDESDIIKDHHERPDGSGFPRALDYKTIPLVTASFILSYQYSHDLLTYKEKILKPEVILNKLDKSFTKGNFARPYKAIERVVNNCK